MAIPNEVHGVRRATFFVRTFASLLGLGAVAWGGFLLPPFWKQAPLNRVASELLQGHIFKRQALLEEARELDAAEKSSFCDPTELHNAVIVRLAILNEAIAAKDHQLIETAYYPLYDSTRRTLSCAPADPFAWLTLFWLDIAKHGFQPNNAEYLRLSYTLGPNEGWIALWRNQLAVALFERLPADLSNDAIEEFIKLVDTGGLYSQTAAIFASAAPAVQSRIIGCLKSAKPIPRQIFVRTLYDQGLDVDIPGVDSPAPPWQYPTR
jgi:hypothetical protein